MERTFSIIIPTLNKRPDITSKLIETIHYNAHVGEIIVVDNTEDGSANYPGNKVIHLPQYKNIYVNPAWNLGVSKSKYDYIAIVNDDIMLPGGFFNAMTQVPLEELGVIGASQNHIIQTEDPNMSMITGFTIRESSIRNWGFGIFMAMWKPNYIFAPEDMKIWCHDDILFHMNAKSGKRNGVVEAPIQTKMSTTSDLPEFDDIKRNDLLLYEEYKKQHGL